MSFFLLSSVIFFTVVINLCLNVRLLKFCGVFLFFFSFFFVCLLFLLLLLFSFLYFIILIFTFLNLLYFFLHLALCLTLASLQESNDKPRQYIKNQSHHFADKDPYSQGYVFPVVMYGCESWTIKKAEHRRTDAFKLMLEKTLESLLESKEVELVNLKSTLNTHWNV